MVKPFRISSSPPSSAYDCWQKCCAGTTGASAPPRSAPLPANTYLLPTIWEEQIFDEQLVVQCRPTAYGTCYLNTHTHTHTHDAMPLFFFGGGGGGVLAVVTVVDRHPPTPNHPHPRRNKSARRKENLRRRLSVKKKKRAQLRNHWLSVDFFFLWAAGGLGGVGGHLFALSPRLRN